MFGHEIPKLNKHVALHLLQRSETLLLIFRGPHNFSGANKFKLDGYQGLVS